MARLIGRYEVLDVIARGSYGQVLAARDPVSGEPVAIKLLSPLRGSDSARRRFEREGQVLTRLRHPGLLGAREVGEVDGTPFIVMDHAAGGSLADRISGAGVLPARLAAEGVREAALAVHYAHEQGVLHRDLKPANVLLGADGRWRVADFGLALDLEEDGPRLSQSGIILGTPGYMALEQARGDHRAVDRRTDVFGLGAVLYACLTGAPPNQGASLPEVLAASARPSAFPLESEGDAALRAICLRCLAPEPSRRYPTAQALADALSGWLTREPTAALRGLAWLGLVGAALGGGLLAFAVLPASEPGGPPTVVEPPPAVEQGGPAARVVRHAKLAERHLGAGDFPGAAREAGLALEIDPTSTEALRLRGTAAFYIARDDTERARAMADLERAVELDPQDAGSWHMLGFFSYLSRRYEQAEGYFTEAMRHRPRGGEDPPDYFYRGWSRLALGNLRGAEDDVSRAIEIEPGGARRYALRAVIRTRLGDRDGALADARRGLEAVDETTEHWVGPACQGVLEALR